MIRFGNKKVSMTRQNSARIKELSSANDSMSLLEEKEHLLMRWSEWYQSKTETFSNTIEKPWISYIAIILELV
jgi:hypothetical protein